MISAPKNTFKYVVFATDFGVYSSVLNCHDDLVFISYLIIYKLFYMICEL